MGFISDATSKIFGKDSGVGGPSASHRSNLLKKAIEEESRRSQEEQKNIKEVTQTQRAAIRKKYEAEGKRISQAQELQRLQEQEFARQIATARVKQAEQALFTRGLKGAGFEGMGMLDSDPSYQLAASNLGIDVEAFRSNEVNQLDLRQRLISNLGVTAGVNTLGESSAAQLRNYQLQEMMSSERSRQGFASILKMGASNYAGSAIASNQGGQNQQNQFNFSQFAAQQEAAKGTGMEQGRMNTTTTSQHQNQTQQFDRQRGSV